MPLAGVYLQRLYFDYTKKRRRNDNVEIKNALTVVEVEIESMRYTSGDPRKKGRCLSAHLHNDSLGKLRKLGGHLQHLCT